MPLLSNFTRGRSPSLTQDQGVDNHKVSSRGSKPPTSGTYRQAKPIPVQQNLGSAPPEDNNVFAKYQRKSSRSPSSFFPGLPRVTPSLLKRPSPQSAPPIAQPLPTTARTRAPPHPRNTDSPAQVVYETQSAPTSVPQQSVPLTWRNIFSRASARDKTPNSTPAARPLEVPRTMDSKSSRVPRHQAVPTSKVFEKVQETKAALVSAVPGDISRPAYVSQPSKSSLRTNSSKPLAQRDSRSTLRSSERPPIIASRPLQTRLDSSKSERTMDSQRPPAGPTHFVHPAPRPETPVVAPAPQKPKAVPRVPSNEEYSRNAPRPNRATNAPPPSVVSGDDERLASRSGPSMQIMALSKQKVTAQRALPKGDYSANLTPLQITSNEAFGGVSGDESLDMETLLTPSSLASVPRWDPVSSFKRTAKTSAASVQPTLSVGYNATEAVRNLSVVRHATATGRSRTISMVSSTSTSSSVSSFDQGPPRALKLYSQLPSQPERTRDNAPALDTILDSAVVASPSTGPLHRYIEAAPNAEALVPHPDITLNKTDTVSVTSLIHPTSLANGRNDSQSRGPSQKSIEGSIVDTRLSVLPQGLQSNRSDNLGTINSVRTAASKKDVTMRDPPEPVQEQPRASRLLAERAPKRLSIAVPPPPANDYVLSPAQSNATTSLPLVVSRVTEAPPAVPQRSTARPATSTLVRMPPTPSVLPAPPPTPQENGLMTRTRPAASASTPGASTSKAPATSKTYSALSSTPEESHALEKFNPATYGKESKAKSPLGQPPSALNSLRIKETRETGPVQGSGLRIEALSAVLSPVETPHRDATSAYKAIAGVNIPNNDLNTARSLMPSRQPRERPAEPIAQKIDDITASQLREALKTTLAIDNVASKARRREHLRIAPAEDIAILGTPRELSKETAKTIDPRTNSGDHLASRSRHPDQLQFNPSPDFAISNPDIGAVVALRDDSAEATYPRHHYASKDRREHLRIPSLDDDIPIQLPKNGESAALVERLREVAESSGPHHEHSSSMPQRERIQTESQGDAPSTAALTMKPDDTASASLQRLREAAELLSPRAELPSSKPRRERLRIGPQGDAPSTITSALVPVAATPIVEHVVPSVTEPLPVPPRRADNPRLIPPPFEDRPPNTSAVPASAYPNPYGSFDPKGTSRARQRTQTLPTPPSSNESIVPKRSATSDMPASGAPLTTGGRTWRSTRSRAPSALNALSPTPDPSTAIPISYTSYTRPSYVPDPTLAEPGHRQREMSLPSSAIPPSSFYPSYATRSAREARLEQAQREFEEERTMERGRVLVEPQERVPRPRGNSFTGTSIPDSKKTTPFAFLSRSRRMKTLSSASNDATGSQAFTSYEAASRKSGFTEFTPPPSPQAAESIVQHWHDGLQGQKMRKPGVTWDVESGSPVASFPKLMSLQQSSG